MSTKPASVPTWATDANYPAGAETYSATPTKVAPTGTRRSRGWEPKKKPPAQVENYERNLIGQWLQYLNDGDLSGNHEIDGDLVVTGNLDVDGDVDIGGAVTSDLELVGEFYHGDMVLNIPGSAGITESASERDYEFFGYSASIDIKTLPATVNTTVWWPLPLRVGDRVKSITFRVLAINTGIAGTVAAADFAIIDASGSPIAMSGNNTSASPSTVSVSSVTLNPTAPVLGVNQHAFAAIVMSAVQDNETGLRVYGVDVTYDRPRP